MYVTIPSHDGSLPQYSDLTVRTTKLACTRLKPGSSLYFEGDGVDYLYQVKSGILRLSRLLEDGRRQVMAFGYPGDIVGFPCDGRHNADCDALTDAMLQPFPRSALERGDADPSLHRELLQAALREISAMQDHFMMLGRKSAMEKVASFLCVLSEQVGEDLGDCRQVNLPMSRADIADFLGLTIETVSRTLSQLRKRGIIRLENIHRVVIQDFDALVGLTHREGD